MDRPPKTPGEVDVLPEDSVASNDAPTSPGPSPCPWLSSKGEACQEPAAILDYCREHAPDYADKLFREAIKRRDPDCRARVRGHCARTTTDCAHIFTRGRWQTRWDPGNAVGLCRGCHRWYTDHPMAWEAWSIAEVFAGDERAFHELEMLSTSTERGAPKVDVAMVIRRLEGPQL